MPAPNSDEMASLVAQFKEKQPYPRESDRIAWKHRADWRKFLEPETLRNLDADRLRRSGTTDAGNPGQMSAFFRQLKDKDGPKKLKDTLEYLLYGPGEISSRLDNLLDVLDGSRACKPLFSPTFYLSGSQKNGCRCSRIAVS